MFAGLQWVEQPIFGSQESGDVLVETAEERIGGGACIVLASEAPLKNGTVDAVARARAVEVGGFDVAVDLENPEHVVDDCIVYGLVEGGGIMTVVPTPQRLGADPATENRTVGDVEQPEVPRLRVRARAGHHVRVGE